MDSARRWAGAVAVRDGRIVYVGPDTLPPGLAGPATEVIDLAGPGLPWVRGGGWQLPLFPDGNPTRALLDQAVPDRPAAFEAADGHSLWVNSRALALAGITRETADPPGGRIERDPRGGEPSGTLRESAMDLVAHVLPGRTEAELLAGLERAQRQANRFGITTLFEAQRG